MLNVIQNKIEQDEMLSVLFANGPESTTNDYLAYSYGKHKWVISIRDSIAGDPIQHRLMISLRATVDNISAFKSQITNRQYVLDFMDYELSVIDPVMIGQRGRLKRSKNIVQVISVIMDPFYDHHYEENSAETLKIAAETVSIFKLFISSFIWVMRPQRRDLRKLTHFSN